MTTLTKESCKKTAEQKDLGPISAKPGPFPCWAHNVGHGSVILLFEGIGSVGSVILLSEDQASAA